MPDWLDHAIGYAMEWITHQVRRQELPGCVIAACHNGAFVIERALGYADLSTGEQLTPRHRFRVASHSKSFTAAAIMRLREQGRLRLDDAVLKLSAKGDVLIKCWRNTLSIGTVHADVTASLVEPTLGHYL